MIRMSKSIGSLMAKSYIKKHSLSSRELNKDKSQYLISSRNNSQLGKKENIELIDVKSQANSDDNYTYSVRNSLKLFENKIDNEDLKGNSNINLIGSISQPLLFEVKNIKNNKKDEELNKRYIIDKYDENCIDDSKIEYLECLLEEQNKNFFYYLLTIVTLGIFALFLEIYPILKVKFSYLRTDIHNASHFFIKCHDGKYYIKKAYEIKLPRLNNNNLANLTKLPVISTHTKFFEFKLH